MESLGINLKNKTGVPNGAIILIRFSTKIEIFSLSNKSLPIIAHLKFDLNAIPSSSLFETVSIEDSTSKLFFSDPDESDATLYVFTEVIVQTINGQMMI
ncbi:MAG: hypothetical protein ACR2LL_01515 [Nitrosopumilus sp.]